MIKADQSNLLPRGLIVDLLTPIDDSGKIDRKALSRLIRFISPWVEGILLFSPDNGGLNLPAKLKAEILRETIEITKLHILTCVTADTTEKTIETIEIIRENDCSNRVVLVDAPLVHRSNRGLPDWLGWMSSYLDCPVVLYNHPAISVKYRKHTNRKNITSVVFKKCLEEVPFFSGMIFKGKAELVKRYQTIAKVKPGFRFYDGSEKRFLDRPGLSGVVSIGANLLPQPWAKVVRSALYIKPQSDSAALLAASKVIRSLASRKLDLQPEIIKCGLQKTGHLNSEPSKQCSENPDDNDHYLRGLDLPRWTKIKH